MAGPHRFLVGEVSANIRIQFWRHGVRAGGGEAAWSVGAGTDRGDVGIVVHVYADGQAYEVESMTLDGRAAAVDTLEAPVVRPVGRNYISHVRELQQS